MSLIAALVLVPAAAMPAAAGPTLLYDASDGRVLYAEEPDQPWYAASLTKMMTAYLLFEDWASGKVKPSDKITVSPYANSQPKMRLGLGAGKEITFEDASKALIMVSANDIAVAIAEALSGSEDAFVERMNATAHRLGLYSTRYINPHGLPGEGQYTSVKDLARLAEALHRDFPQHAPLFAMTESTIGKRVIGSHNPVLKTVPGGDGLKTGFTCSAGYNIVATATRDGRRLVAIILGAKNLAERSDRARRLFHYGFSRREWKALFPGQTWESLPEERYDRQAAREVNLAKRYLDCRDPVPELVVAGLDLPTTSLDPEVVLNVAAQAARDSLKPKLPDGAASVAGESKQKKRHTVKKLRSKHKSKTASR